MKTPAEKNDELALAPTTPAPVTITEIRADPDFVFEPWFRSKQVSYQIRALKTVSEREAWSDVFEKRGCIVCRTKNRSHASLGMCSVCHQRIKRWLRYAMRLRDTGEPQTFTFDNEEIAMKALLDARRTLSTAATEEDHDEA